MRLLLIEDDLTVAEGVELMLRAEDFQVETADFGQDGIDLAKLNEYDIVLLDLNLPDMSGYDVLRALRIGRVKTPILILSGLNGIDN
jgi:two-component system cell cycle response regulator CtrA